MSSRRKETLPFPNSFLSAFSPFWKNILYICIVKFMYSEKATKFCEISTLLFTKLHTVKSKAEISQNFVAFSEYMNFIWMCLHNCMIVDTSTYHHSWIISLIWMLSFRTQYFLLKSNINTLLPWVLEQRFYSSTFHNVFANAFIFCNSKKYLPYFLI